MSLRPFRVELDEANAFVALHHRHHDPSTGHRFSLGVGDSQLRGVAICGRPVGRKTDQRAILEVNRVCTDGTRNACSWLYSHAAQVATTMGFHCAVTFTAIHEQGASLRACGWWPEVMAARSDYSFAGGDRTREAKRGKEVVQKIRWIWLTGNEVAEPIAMPVDDSQLTLDEVLRKEAA